MTKLSAVVIARNEERNIAECLSALQFCDERIVVDSGSVDHTGQIAKEHGASVFTRAFDDFAAQKNFGISKATGEWLILVDADERVSSELAREIQAVLEMPPAEAYFLKRKNRIFGRWMRYGANRNDLQLRLVRRQGARFEGVVHERLVVSGKSLCLKNPLLHFSTRNVAEYVQKLNLYTDLEIRALSSVKASASTARMLWRPLAVFFYRAVWQGGLMDGREGFVFCALSAYYEFIRLAKYRELSVIHCQKKVRELN